MISFTTVWKRLGPLLLLMGGMVLQGCVVIIDNDHDNDVDTEQDLRGKTWRLEVIVHHGQTYSVQDRTYRLTFEADGRITGVADCNVFGGLYEVPRNGAVEIFDLFSTEVACQPPALDELFLRDLGDVTHFDVDGSRLTIRFDAEDNELRFRRA